MAQHFEGGEMWLPSRYLSDEMGFLEKQLPCDIPYADSVVSSIETESDEEDYMAGLTQSIARSTLEDDDKGSPVLMVSSLAGSPQSTLCSLGSWSGRSLDSSDGSRGSSNGPSQVSSPPSMPLNQKDDAWELLYAAAGQVVRMKLHGEGGMFQERGLLGPPKKPVTAPAVELKTTNSAGHQLHRCWSENDRDSSALVAHFQYLKQQRSWARQARMGEAQQVQSMPRVCSNSRVIHSSYANPQNPSANNGMRPVFLTKSGSKKECSGTGVFLPRTGHSQPGFRKKSGCSTVFLPARVVQALNLNIDDMVSAQRSYYQGTLIPGFDVTLQPQAYTRNGVLSSQRRIIRPQQPVISNELRLPQEWTY